jgi:signal transduction histidine kinase/DNA-binding response OmpR family regulator
MMVCIPVLAGTAQGEQQDKFSAEQVSEEVADKATQLEKTWRWTLAIASICLLAAGILYYQKFRIRRVYLKELEDQNQLIKEQKEEIETINHQLEKQMILRKQTDETINYFASSLFGKNTIDEILWDVAKNCIARLGLVDCVIYLLDEKRGVLIQKAAYGQKNPEEFKIHVPIEIAVGKGIVGAVAASGVAEIVGDASLDPRYIVDDQQRFSELAVPLIIHSKVIGVIDSEHPEKNFFTQYHLDALTTIASICSSKISQAQADERANEAREAQLEAEQIKKMEQLKSQFFANISHEFRTPLNLILAPLQKKQNQLSALEIDLMTRNAKRLLRLVNELLDLAKMEVGLVKPEIRNIDLFLFMKDIAHSFCPLAEAKEITYHIEIPERNYIAGVDSDKLEKIAYNLLSNAFKFTPRQGTVTIRAAIDSIENFVFVVSDSGIGIPKTLQSKIFTRFYQVDASQTRAFGGTGIGLALTKELVDLLQGTISVNSEVGKGSTFTVALPTKVASEEIVNVVTPFTDVLVEAESYYPEISDKDTFESTVQETSDNPVILFVEDNGDLRKYMRSELSGQFTMVEAANGEEGLALARKKIPDLIITDIMMPVMDGVTFTKNLRDDECTSHIPIILLTARDDGETKIKGFETGAEQYVVKPFDISELIARIHGLLAQRERLRKKFSHELTLEPTKVSVNNKDAVFLDKLVKVIESNISNDAFTVEQLQSEIAMSRMQLHRKLKALTNQSASDFIRSIRLKRAAQILRQPGIQVAEAAYGAGFNHMSYFSKCFKEQFGVLPSEYGNLGQ